jgi:hypothetical protein
MRDNMITYQRRALHDCEIGAASAGHLDAYVNSVEPTAAAGGELSTSGLWAANPVAG